jgi:hypothetical protein
MLSSPRQEPASVHMMYVPIGVPGRIYINNTHQPPRTNAVCWMRVDNAVPIGSLWLHER